MMGYGFDMLGWGWMMGFGVLIVFGSIALTLYLIFRQPSYQTDIKPHGNSALDILNGRYAKGEISDEEYKQKKSELLK